MESLYFENVLCRYHSADLKNKKYGRFYLSYFANWIASEIYEKGKEDEDAKRKLMFYPYLVSNDNIMIENLRKHAYKFDLLLFFLLNELIDSRKKPGIDENQVLNVIEFIINEPSTRKLLNDLSEIPETILSDENREFFIVSYQTILKRMAKRTKIMNAKNAKNEHA